VSAIAEIVLGREDLLSLKQEQLSYKLVVLANFLLPHYFVSSIGFPPSQVSVLVRRARPPPIVLLPPILMLLAVAVSQ
jgi:hypothetical protein